MSYDEHEKTCIYIYTYIFKSKLNHCLDMANNNNDAVNKNQPIHSTGWFKRIPVTPNVAASLAVSPRYLVNFIILRNVTSCFLVATINHVGMGQNPGT